MSTITTLRDLQVSPDRFTIISGPNCMRCTQTTNMLDRSDVDYDIIDTAEQEEVLQTLRESGFSSLPVVLPPIQSKAKPWGGFELMKLRSVINSLSTEEQADG